MMKTSERYLEDFAVGQTFGSGRLRVDKERIKTFAAEFDPQPFHLDEEAAHHSIFQVLGKIRLRPAGEIQALAQEPMTLRLSFFFGNPRFGCPRPVRCHASNAGGNDVADPPGSRPQRQKASEGADKPWGADDTARGQQEFHRSHPPLRPEPAGATSVPPTRCQHGLSSEMLSYV
jgi:hypothetical protein